MPLTLEEFLACEPTLLALEKAMTKSEPRDFRRLRHDEAALRRMLVAHWESGMLGSMTPEEAATVAAELTVDAQRQQIDARAEVRDDCLVFAGGRYGEQHLQLSATSPVRARKHWPGYLAACPAVRQLDLLTRVFGWARGKMGRR